MKNWVISMGFCIMLFEDIHGHEKFMELFKKNYI